MDRHGLNKSQWGRPPLSDQQVKLFVSRLPDDVSSRDVRELFAPHGNLISCEILGPRSRARSAFVVYPNIEEGLQAIEAVHGQATLCHEKGPLRVRLAQGEAARHGIPEDEQPGGEGIRVFIGNIPKTMKAGDLEVLFGMYGMLDDAAIYPAAGFFNSGFVVYWRKVDAHRAIRQLDGKFYPLKSALALHVRLARRAQHRSVTENEATQTEPLHVLGLPSLPQIDRHFVLPIPALDDPKHISRVLAAFNRQMEARRGICMHSAIQFELPSPNTAFTYSLPETFQEEGFNDEDSLWFL